MTRGAPAVSGAVAAGLGLLAFAADAVDGAAGQVLVALTSSGFAWGLAAFLAGRAADGRRRPSCRPRCCWCSPRSCTTCSCCW
ncbi:hypothetical protein [Dactylosporangium sp. NPDC049140]|uniref:hypothetical protein n=1 Tax=Dactylosporangium sp. NPDC049140 TaxID=3155647 RepID=UPI0033EFA062